MSGTTVGVIAAILVGMVFLMAAVTKLAGSADWQRQAQGLGVPRVIAVMVPFVEAALGALLMVQWHRTAVAWCAVAVLVGFTMLLALRLAQGQRPPCACFGALSARPIGPGNVVRNLVLIAIAVVAAVA